MKLRWFYIAIAVVFLLGCEREPVVFNPIDDVPPIPPAGLLVERAEDGFITISWLRNEERDIRRYIIYRSEDSAATVFTAIDSTIRTFYIDEQRSYDTTYHYQVTAKDESGNESNPSAIVSAKGPNLREPKVPLFFEVLSTQLNQERIMRLTWTATDDSDLKGYRIYRGEGVEFPPAEYVFLGFTNANLYDDTSASETGRLYTYRIAAIDNGDLESEPTSPSSDVHLTIPDLISPADKARVNRFPEFVWEPVQSAIMYRIELMESPSGGILWHESVEANPSEESIRVPYLGFALQIGIPYYWRVLSYSKANAPANSTSEVRVFQTVP